jgi:hypothetical protein
MPSLAASHVLAIGDCHRCPRRADFAIMIRAPFAGVTVALRKVHAVAAAVLGAIAARTHLQDGKR